jgi:hypothetical protein
MVLPVRRVYEMDVAFATNFYLDMMTPAKAGSEPSTGITSGGPALTLLLTTAMQESGLSQRRQIGGPARSFWQFESGGGVKGVMTHPTTAGRLQALCGALVVPWDQATIFEAMAWNDTLAFGMARLLYWTDPAALPDDADSSWQYYLRNWRPGKPKPDTWGGFYAIATQVVSGPAGA